MLLVDCERCSYLPYSMFRVTENGRRCCSFQRRYQVVLRIQHESWRTQRKNHKIFIEELLRVLGLLTQGSSNLIFANLGVQKM